MKLQIDTISGLRTEKDGPHSLMVHLMDDSDMSISIWLDIPANDIKCMTIEQIEKMATQKFESNKK